MVDMNLSSAGAGRGLPAAAQPDRKDPARMVKAIKNIDGKGVSARLAFGTIARFSQVSLVRRAVMEGQDIIIRVDAMKKELQELGCEIREDWLGGKDCTLCEIRGKRIVFIDLESSPQELSASLARLVAELKATLIGQAASTDV